ncbi:MAG: hypothetical protein J5933_01650 [Clostridia bacterium]|nr:hypothetical protein [Clostridia bacterium]
MKKNKELVAALIFFLPQISYYISALLSSYKLSTFTVPVYALIAVLAVISYFWVFKNRRCFILIYVLVVSILLTDLINPATEMYMIQKPIYTSGLVSMFLYYMPPFLLLLSGADLKSFYSYYSRLSIIVLIAAVIAYLNYVIVLRVAPPDYMTFAYLMLSPIFFCFAEGVKKNVWSLILAIAGSIVILIIGCRGALLTLFVFYVLFMFFLSPERGTVNNALIKTAVVVASAVVFIKLDSILKFIQTIISKIGRTSRTLNFISSLENSSISTILDSDGRSIIWGNGIRQIGVFGKGLFGDRTVLTDGIRKTDVYAHNWILELLIDLGIFIGGALAIFLLYVIIKAFVSALRSDDYTHSVLAISMVSVLLVKHMLSASLLTSFDFWAYAGVAAGLLIYYRDLDSEEYDLSDEGLVIDESHRT